MSEAEKKSGSLIKKLLLFGCGGTLLIGIMGACVVGFWLATGPTGGVRVANDMEEYALEYIDQHGLLEPGEELLAYYDVTIRLDSSEAAILTDKRVIYHKNDRTTSIPIREIEDVDHRNETMIGDVFEIYGEAGNVMRVEIAPFNQGPTFKKILMKTWRNTQEEQARAG